jgi:hypothetical protein
MNEYSMNVCLKNENKIAWVHMLMKCAVRAYVDKCVKFVMMNVFCGPVLTFISVHVARKDCSWAISPSAADFSNHVW